MNTALNIRALAFAGAVTGALAILACFALGSLLGRPDPWMALFVGSGPTLGGWMIGIAEGALVGLFEGALIGVFYNRFARP
jgi:hypothetical protein